MALDFLIPVLPYPADAHYYGLLAPRLERLGASVGLLCTNSEAVDKLRAAGNKHVFHLYEGFDPRRAPDPARVDEIERRWKVDSLADHVYPERQYWGGTFDDNLARAVHSFDRIEALCREHGVRMFINNLGGEMMRRTMQRLADGGLGPKNVIIDYTPFHGRSTYTTDEVKWDELPDDPPALAPEEREFITRYLAEATSKKKMFATPGKLGINAGSLYRPLVRIARELTRRGEQRDENLAFVYEQRLRHVARRAWNPRLYEQPVPGEPYLFFPLHVANDMAITIRAPQFQNQDNVLEFLAERALPTGTKLYVKPHPAGLDSYPVGMMNRIKRMPHVRLIHPTINSHQLIAGARGVVVINSTVGCEALMYEKPVVVLGRIFYRGRGLTHDCDYLGDLRSLVRHAIDHPPDHEAILRFFHACWKASYPGIFAELDEASLDHVARGFVDKAARIGRPVGGSPPVAA